MTEPRLNHRTREGWLCPVCFSDHSNQERGECLACRREMAMDRPDGIAREALEDVPLPSRIVCYRHPTRNGWTMLDGSGYLNDAAAINSYVREGWRVKILHVEARS